ncbi:Efflux pump ustT [Lachnellula arida]|uniref:Efflux pump ustT n=1 Tax=Lachnellula arida TaxID=1316785 RepID=A0A8T9B894_9HELO|nr:Efflux pump ustT [Lachnellula arida]
MATHDLLSAENTPNLSGFPIVGRKTPFFHAQPKWARPRLSFNIRQTRSPRVVTGIIFTIIFVMAFGGNLMAVPGLRLWEDIICHHYYNDLQGENHVGFDGHINEGLCKGDEVQNQLNIFIGVLAFLTPIPSLLTTIPYGLLADRIGRKPVFALAMVGTLLGGCYNMLVMSLWRILPIQLLWFSPMFMFIGGGSALASMMFYAIGCDITTEANRTNLFLFGHGASLLGGLIAPTVAGVLMAISPWIAMILGITILAIGSSLVVFVPETLHLRLSASGTLVEASPAERDLSPTRKTDKSRSYFVTVKSQFADGLNNISSSTAILHSLPVVLLLLTFVSHSFASVGDDISLRYISKRFQWKLQETSFLLSLRASINLALVLVIIPLLSSVLMQRLGLSSKGKDLFLARFSIIVLVMGALLMASSETIGLTIFGLIVTTLGTGYSAFVRSLITTLVDQKHVGRLFAAVSVVETLGSLAAGPSLNALYSVGLKRGGSWIGLPFYCVAVICFIAGVGVWSFGILTRKQRRRQEMGFGEEYGDDYADAQSLFGDLDVLEPDHADEGRIRI